MKNLNKYLLAISTLFLSYELSSSPLVKGNLHIPKMDRIKSNSSVTNIYKLQSQLFETWLPWSNQWRNSDKVNYSYNTMQLVGTSMDQNWDSVSNTWMNNSVDSFMYDKSGNQILHITRLWNNNIYGNASEISDSINGNVKTETVYGWDNTGYIAQYRDIYFLDSNRRDTLDINQGWDGSSWTNSAKYQFQYNGQGKVITVLTSQWIGNNWQVSDRELNYYDIDGNDTLYVHQTPGSKSGTWIYVFNQQSKITYNGNRDILQVIQNGSYDNIKWTPFNKFDYSYDGNGNDTQYVVQAWDSIAKSWVNNGRYTMTYQVFTGVNFSKTNQAINVYPNPSIDDINFEYILAEGAHTKISIYDLTGKEACVPFNGFETSGHHMNSYKLSLVPGVYIYMIQSANHIYRGRLVIL